MKVCTVEGCERKRSSTNWCDAHYKRWKKYGTVRADVPLRNHFSGAPEERFWHYVEKQDSGCWLWTGSVTQGYGGFWDGQRRVQAHRWAYEQLVGPIPQGLVIDHLCEVPTCVNPAHMEPVTDEVNILRGDSGSARNYRKTHCKRGHPLSGSNLILEAHQRKCRTCTNERQRQPPRRPLEEA